MHTSLEDAVTNGASSAPPKRKRRLIIVAGLGVAGAILLAALFLSREWPFAKQNVIQQLSEATASNVQLGAFRQTFFPHPGCVLDDVTLTRGSDPGKKTVMHVKSITIVGNLVGLFAKHLALIELRGAQVKFPPYGAGEGWTPTRSKIVLDKLVANDASLEFASRKKNGNPVKFAIHDLAAHHLATGDPMTFEVRLSDPIPPGEITADGSFGPWTMDQLGNTPVSGNYIFREADLSAFEGIGGILSSSGKFNGTLESIAVEGSMATPDFVVRGSSHKADLKSDFKTEVDPSNGDITLQHVAAHLRQTTIISQGSIASHRDEDGKRADLDLAVRKGRIQDLLLLFVEAKKAPLSGSVSLKVKSVIPPGREPFLKKLKLTGDFGIDDAQFSQDETQESVEKLSASARGKTDEQDDPESVVSNLQGQVTVQNGIANFSKLSFRVPGALANLHGTFDLISQRIDLHGTLLMEATLPRATSGVKSFLLKAIDPFLKKNRHGGAKFPVSITGTYQKPEYRADPI